MPHTPLGRDPATTLHHVRRLTGMELLEALPARRGNRGAREIPYRATALSWRLDWRDEDGSATHEAMLEAYLAEVADVGVERVDQTRLVLALDEGGAAEFRDRLHALMQEFAARAVDPSGSRQAVYVAFYPGG
ncbi:MAG: ArsR family transcriptional regulator [Pseudonocardiaceae bacterium]|nr:ArsR family transcriptional regulator [Pseudonocardiaceae bacterium]